ncbi:MAG: glutamate--tRNA ligase [Synergistaceae bacterium]|jgi:glutamyl-tRNA synthetase|nr:glutamate--tRNA ligase [Synergistaceae bacterium]
MPDSGVRVRFAPSPTGALHIGGAHTALFNWLWARRNGGSFVLRVEDTDRERSTAEYERTIMDGLKWLGLNWDEGPDIGGGYGPYRQSERMDSYRRRAMDLLDRGLAYKEGEAVIFRVPEGEDLVLHDIIYGDINVQSDRSSMKTDGSIKDIVIIKSDGMPTYNYAVVVDDHDMNITCVIRGEDHISNTPKQMLLYRALGWEAPQFAHLPMILGGDKKKLSKRHGATSVFEYNDMGYLPDAMFNFLALLGWTPGNGLEIFDRELAAKKFELSRVIKKPSVFDMNKLNFVNQEHLKALAPKTRREIIEPFWRSLGLSPERFDCKYLEDALTLMGGRGRTTKELAEYSDYFLDFGPVKDRYDASEITPERKDLLRKFFTELFGSLKPPDWSAAKLEAAARGWCESNGASLKDVAMPLRWALTGRKVSPGVFEVAELLGRDECWARLARYEFIV